MVMLVLEVLVMLVVLVVVLVVLVQQLGMGWLVLVGLVCHLGWLVGRVVCWGCPVQWLEVSGLVWGWGCMERCVRKVCMVKLVLGWPVLVALVCLGRLVDMVVWLGFWVCGAGLPPWMVKVVGLEVGGLVWEWGCMEKCARRAVVWEGCVVWLWQRVGGMVGVQVVWCQGCCLVEGVAVQLVVVMVAVVVMEVMATVVMEEVVLVAWLVLVLVVVPVSVAWLVLVLLAWLVLVLVLVVLVVQ